MTNLTFDDVLIKPKFSNVKSRKDVDLSVSFKQDYSKEICKLALPVLSANMDTVTGPTMAIAMKNAGGLGVLHRFGTIEETVDMYNEVGASTTSEPYCCAVSVGVGELEKQRAIALYNARARIFVLDVAHGAQLQVVEQYIWLKENLPGSFVIVGNFATADSCIQFWTELNGFGNPDKLPSIRYYTIGKGSNKEHHAYGVDAFKIGIGPGSACTTRIKTGCGVPQLSAIIEIAACFKQHLHKPLIIADGGMKTPGDIAKALAAGADCVMLGGMLAGTDETPGEIYNKWGEGPYTGSKDRDLSHMFKKYRGSASKESYSDQGKDDSWRTAEGESFVVPCKGPVAQVLQDIEGGLRSAFTYVGAKTIADFHERAEFTVVTSSCSTENKAHGKS